jgi:hypothetical protein
MSTECSAEYSAAYECSVRVQSMSAEYEYRVQCRVQSAA